MHRGHGVAARVAGVLGVHEFGRITDPPTRRRLAVLTIVSIGIAALEVLALAAIGPLIQLLSGGNLEDAGFLGQRALEIVGPDRSQRDQALILLAIVVGLLIARAVLAAIIRWWTIGFINESAARASINLFSEYLRAPLSFFANRNSATFARTVAISLNSIFLSGLLGVTTILTEASMIVIMSILLLVASPIGALCSIVYFGVVLYCFARYAQRSTAALAREKDEIHGAWLTTMQQAIGGLREVRLRHVEAEYVETFAEARLGQMRLERRIMFGAEFGRYYLEASFMAGFGLLATVVLLTQGDSAAATLGLMMAAGFRLLPSAGRFLGAVSSVRQGKGSLATVAEEFAALGLTNLDQQATFSDTSELTPLERIPMAIRFDHVSFRYPGAQKDALCDLTGQVPAGSSLGIVGRSGSGKTTTTDLLCGLVEPTSGAILFDGTALPRDDKSWQRRIGYVAQDTFVTDGTLAQNIAFTTGTVDDAALREAIDLAQLDDWITSLPEGVQTRTGERGALLSGGQRQRLGIARALYNRPSLLILDEATSALDVETESHITSAVTALGGQVTVVVVAHRLSTVRQCDAIVVLDEGRIVGWGPFEQLARENERFAEWVELAGMTASGNVNASDATVRRSRHASPSQSVTRQQKVGR